MGLLEMGSLDKGFEVLEMPTDIVDKILQHEDIWKSDFTEFVAFQFRKFGHGVPLKESFGTIKARIDDGRWIVDCPNCNSALVPSALVPLFICAECGSPDNAGRWRRVEYPEDRQEIERLLLLRPAGMGRGFIEGSNIPIGGPRFFSEDDVNYERDDTIYRLMPGQTVDDLRRENEELGCGI